MNYTALSRNIAAAFLAQLISLFLSFVISLVVPKVLGVDAFSYWQLFLFYSGYSGFFMLGLNDGIYLIHGGEKRSEIDRSSVAGQYRIGMTFQLLVCALLTAVVLTHADGSRKFVLLATSIYVLLFNATMYLSSLFQAMNETRLYSYSVVVEKTTFLIALVVLVASQQTDFRLYIIWYMVSKFLSFLFSIWKARYLVFCKRKPLKNVFSDVMESISVGIKLMLANVAGMLILGVARFAVDTHWGLVTFGQFSFAISIAGFLLTFATQLSMVFFPALRQGNQSSVKRAFSALRDGLDLGLPALYVFYFPIEYILSLWLPQYTEGLFYFGLVLPICIFDGKMSILGTTYLKVLRKENLLLAVNFATVLLSILGVALGSVVFNSIPTTILAMTAALAARSIWTERWVTQQLGLSPSFKPLIEIAASVIFVSIVFFASFRIAFTITLVLYAIYLITQHNDIRKLYRVLGNFASGRTA